MGSGWNWLLVVAGALLILVEVAFGGFAGFDLVLIGSAFLLGGGIGMLTHSPVIGLVVASALCVGYIAVGRRWVRARLRDKTVLSNADALLGQRAVVTTRVAEHAPGQVKVRDEVWRAVPAPGAGGPFDEGAVVTVEGVDGVTLRVR
jgi:membrane protein implicated in regulation of membrane protease activity